jgi:hypothetical protein
MKSEMDVLDMDERRRLAWLRANRITLFCVGITWIGMVAWELLHQRTPFFMIVMVPVFAVIRYVSYLKFVRTK